MLRCLKLAQNGFGHVSPNPMVGCVIVYNERIIGEGYHKYYGGPHAEVEAFESVTEHNHLKDATLYVSLEPCSHHGKTPPCTDLIIEKKIKNVKIGVQDPNPIIAGTGIKRLIEAGIEVSTGILEKDCRMINKRFFTYYLKHRPYVILKWAESADGFISAEGIKQISGLAAQTRLHKWRSEEDAFLIGTNTLIQDNPQLNTRLWKGKDPVRIAIDFNLRSNGLPLKFFNSDQKSILLNGVKNEHAATHLDYIKIESTDPSEILQALFRLNIQSVVVEGGQKLINSFIRSNLYDEIRCFKSKSLTLKQGLRAQKIDFQPSLTEDLIDDVLMIY